MDGKRRGGHLPLENDRPGQAVISDNQPYNQLESS